MVTVSVLFSRFGVTLAWLLVDFTMFLVFTLFSEREEGEYFFNEKQIKITKLLSVNCTLRV